MAVVLFGFALNRESSVLGGSQVIGSTYYGSTDSTSTITSTATTTGPILSLDGNRTNAKVCYLTGTSTVFLHQLAQSTTTGTGLNGIPLYPTTTQAQICESFPGFKGYLIGVSNGQPVTVTVSSWK